MFAVFEALWPKEFKALGVNPCSPLADRVQAYQMLHDLLSEKMPLYECEWEMMLEEEGDEGMEDDFISYIPLEPQGSDEYQEWNLDYVPLAQRVILTICSDRDHDDTVKALVREKIPFEQIDSDVLGGLCLLQKSPLRHLWDLFASVYCRTGNEILDITQELYDQSEKPDWSVHAVKWFIAEWKAAQPIIKRAQQFNAWLEKDLRRIRQVEKLLKQATKPRERVRVRVGSEALVHTLADVLGDGFENVPFDEELDNDDD